MFDSKADFPVPTNGIEAVLMSEGIFAVDRCQIILICNLSLDAKTTPSTKYEAVQAATGVGGLDLPSSAGKCRRSTAMTG